MEYSEYHCNSCACIVLIVQYSPAPTLSRPLCGRLQSGMEIHLQMKGRPLASTSRSAAYCVWILVQDA